MKRSIFHCVVAMRLLRHASRIPQYDLEDSVAQSFEGLDEFDLAVSKSLIAMSGTLQSFSDRASPIDRSIVTGLCAHLQLKLTDDVSVVFKEYEDAAREYRLRDSRDGAGAARAGAENCAKRLLKSGPNLKNKRTGRMWRCSKGMPVNSSPKS